MRATSDAPSGTRTGAASATAADWPGTHAASSFGAAAPLFMSSVALRTIAGVPGLRSIARSDFPAAPASGRMTSCVASAAVASRVNGAGIATSRSGGPDGHPVSSATGGGAFSGLPRGAPPVAQTSTRSSSRAVSFRGCHAGIVSLSSSIRSDSAHGDASS